MDGNGRWATRRGLPRLAGHRQGVEALRGVIEGCVEEGVDYLTLFAFSTENWTRPRQEVDGLMSLLVEYFQREIASLDRKGVRIRVIGERQGVRADIVRLIERAEELTRSNTKLVLTVAFNYGGRAEICSAARQVARLARDGRLDPEEIDEAVFARYLYAPDLPDPDLLIRPSGELRISNFLLWQLAYAEMWFTPAYWPDFGKEYLRQAIAEFRLRSRRYGGLDSPKGV
ncbi:MAG: di-trans,poly-cis-decaprenylcistransferase [Firmicutes bacterium]|nr:di-trans,poly-cis-decaprenylcistransferase [Bacillota bacterium]